MGRFPNFAVFAFVLVLASIGLPGLNNFVSEMLMLAGLFDARNPGVHRLGLAVVAAIGILLSAWYMLTMMQRVFFNPLKEPEAANPAVVPTDVGPREFIAFGTLAGLCLVLGLFPQPVLDSMRWDVKQLNSIGREARARVTGIPAPPEVHPVEVIPSGPGGAPAGMPGGGGGKGPPGKGPPGAGGGGNPKGGGGVKGKLIGEDE